MRTSFKLAIALAAMLAAAYGIARTTPYWFAPRQTAQVDTHDPALIAQGQYLSRAADCAACHTAPGGKPFAGGLAMPSPIGTIYSSNITPDARTGKRKALYEPVHGSAPDIAGKGIANPIAMIASFAMCLRYSFDMVAEADRLEAAIAAVLDEGLRTKDIMSPGKREVGTAAMGDAVIARYAALSA